MGFKGKANLKNPDRTFIIIDNNKTKYFGKLIACKPNRIYHK